MKFSASAQIDKCFESETASKDNESDDVVENMSYDIVWKFRLRQTTH